MIRKDKKKRYKARYETTSYKHPVHHTADGDGRCKYSVRRRERDGHLWMTPRGTPSTVAGPTISPAIEAST